MHQSSALWYHAATLHERLHALRAAQTEPTIIDHAQAERRLAVWQAQPPFSSDDWFDRRLALDGLTLEELLLLLGEPIHVTAQRFTTPLAWLNQLVAVLGHSGSTLVPPPTSTALTRAFWDVIAPLLGWSHAQLEHRLQPLLSASRSPLHNASAQLLLGSLPERLIEILQRTLVLELHVARVQNRLAGATPEARFQSFVAQFRQPGHWSSLLAEYPVLARQIMECIDQALRTSILLAERLDADWPLIVQTFDHLRLDDHICAVEDTGADSHAGGQRVLIVHLARGGRVVYKPRSQAVTAHFQGLLHWINHHQVGLPLRPLHVLERDGYGWVEFVAREACTSIAEIERFYQRQGMYLALLMSLQATDIHYQNVLACGEQPIILDLETLFWPQLADVPSNQQHQFAHAQLDRSVLGVGLLPDRSGVTAHEPGIDLSGLGGWPGQTAPHTRTTWQAIGTDQMRLIEESYMIQGGQNLPILDDQPVLVTAYVEALLRGFGQMYDGLLAQRNTLLALDGPLAQFAHDPIRVVVRPTQFYVGLLRDSLHPDMLRNALDRERLWDRLWASVPHQPGLHSLLAVERSALMQQDVPLLQTTPAGHSVYGPDHVQINGLIVANGISMVERRLNQLSLIDRAQQCWLIRAACATLEPAPPIQLRAEQNAPNASVATGDALLVAASEIAAWLATQALHDGPRATWIGLQRNYQHWQIRPLDFSLYSGSAGIVLFLAYVGHLTAEPRSTALAQAGLVGLRQQLAQTRRPTIGAWSGLGGVIYTLWHVAHLWQQPALLAEAEVLIKRLAGLIERDTHYDLIGGAAGSLAVLAGLQQMHPSATTLTTAIACGEHLLSHAQSLAAGVGWATLATTPPLSGLAHGGSGIAWPLSALADLTGEQRWADTALAALAYEQHLFVPTAGNWQDLRGTEAGKPPSFKLAWCHGAPGIGLARHLMSRYIQHPQLAADLRIALHTTCAGLDPDNDSLCHGLLGNLELVLQVADHDPAPMLQATLRTWTARLLSQAPAWRCATPSHTPSPELMTGLAGIGYGLLRLAAPATVPAVLTLAPPNE